MKRKQWQYNPNEGDNAVSEVGTEDIVYYVDTILPEVTTEVVNDWNNDVPLEVILKKLHKDVDRVSPDEYEYMNEQIKAFINLVSTESETIIDMPEEQTGVETGTGKPEGAPIVNSALEANTVTPEPDKPTERKQRAPNKPKTTGKAVSAAEVIALLQEKLELTQYIGNITVEDVPVGTKMSAKGREALTGLNKAIENLKVEAILTIIAM